MEEAEANVAISIANFGGGRIYIPDCRTMHWERLVSQSSVLTISEPNILFGGHALGTYYMEKAAAMLQRYLRPWELILWTEAWND